MAPPAVIGKEYGVNGRTIRRDAEFAKGIDMAEKTAPGIRDAILSGEVKVSKETVAQLPSMPKRQGQLPFSRLLLVILQKRKATILPDIRKKDGNWIRPSKM